MNLKTKYPVIAWAEGRYLYAADGKAYLDGASGGVGAANIGHGVPEILEAIAEQSKKICHANASLFMNESALELADLIIEKFAPTGMEKVYFVSTGTEATELCIKLARVYQLYSGQLERLSRKLPGGSFLLRALEPESPVSALLLSLYPDNAGLLFS